MTFRLTTTFLALALGPLPTLVGSDILIKQVSSPPTIDGIVDPLWSGVDPVEITISYVGSGPATAADFAANARTVWDADGLYFLFEVSDDVYVDDSTAGNGWQDDSIQIYIDSDNAKSAPYDANDANLILRRNDERPLEGAIPTSFTDQVQWTVSESTGGYTMEASITWAALQQTPSAGLLFGLDFQGNDDDGGNPNHVLKWFDTVGNGYNNAAVFAEAELSAEMVVPSADVTILKVDGAVQIDGTPDPVWAEVPAWPLEQVYVASSTPDPANLSASVRALWDDTYLYYLFEVTDDIYADDSAQGWQDDSVQVYFDANNAKGSAYDADDDGVILRRNDAKAAEGNASKPYVANLTWAVKEGTGSYTAEVAVAWSAFNLTPAAGILFGLDFQVNDDDGNDPDTVLKLFDTVGNGYANPAVFGTAILNAHTVTNSAYDYLGYLVENLTIQADDWLGPLSITHAPWVYSPTTSGWMYLAEDTVGELGGWVYYIE